MLVQKFSSLYSALGSSVDNTSQAGSRQDNGWGDLRNGRSASKRGRGRPKGQGRTRGGKSQGRMTNSRDEPCNAKARPGWKGQTRARGGSKKGRRSIRSRQKPAPRAMGNVSNRRVAKGVVCDDDTAGVQHDEWNLAATPVENEGAENVSSSERSEFDNDNDNGQASADEFDDLSVDGFSGARSGKSGHFTEDIEYGGMVGKDGERVEDADDVDYVNYDDEYNEEEEDDDGDDVMEDREDYYGEGYMNTAYQDEGNQSAGGEQAENAERSSDGDSPSSSSDYSY